jgi:hypothetical protein
MLPGMETNRTDGLLPGRLDAEIFSSFGDEDSIVDRLLALPVATSAREDGLAAWEAGIARRLEKMLAERIRERIEGRA